MPLPPIPDTPKSAYNPKRPASALICAQIAHLEHAVGIPPKPRKPWTEGAAAAYIGTLTARLLAPAGGAADHIGAESAPLAKPRARKTHVRVTKAKGAKRKTRRR